MLVRVWALALVGLAALASAGRGRDRRCGLGACHLRRLVEQGRRCAAKPDRPAQDAFYFDPVDGRCRKTRTCRKNGSLNKRKLFGSREACRKRCKGPAGPPSPPQSTQPPPPADPCEEKVCPEGKICKLNGRGKARCVKLPSTVPPPPADPCALVRCKQGYRCRVKRGQAKCVRPHPPKDGTCPAPDPLKVCVQEKDQCRKDKQCPNAAKCCPQPGCGKECKIPPEVVVQCSQRAKTGPCKAAFTNWFYNRETGACESFTYGGCKGNDNRFESAEACERRCGGVPQCPVQSLAPLTDEEEERGCKYRLKQQKDGCFLYVKKCPKEPRIERCSHEADHGPCKAKGQPRWWYNRVSQQCEEFLWACQGNSNNFKTKKGCERKCGKVPPCPTQKPEKLTPQEQRRGCTYERVQNEETFCWFDVKNCPPCEEQPDLAKPPPGCDYEDATDDSGCPVKALRCAEGPCADPRACPAHVCDRCLLTPDAEDFSCVSNLTCTEGTNPCQYSKCDVGTRCKVVFGTAACVPIPERPGFCPKPVKHFPHLKSQDSAGGPDEASRRKRESVVVKKLCRDRSDECSVDEACEDPNAKCCEGECGKRCVTPCFAPPPVVPGDGCVLVKETDRRGCPTQREYCRPKGVCPRTKRFSFGLREPVPDLDQAASPVDVGDEALNRKKRLSCIFPGPPGPNNCQEDRQCLSGELCCGPDVCGVRRCVSACPKPRRPKKEPGAGCRWSKEFDAQGCPHFLHRCDVCPLPQPAGGPGESVPFLPISPFGACQQDSDCGPNAKADQMCCKGADCQKDPECAGDDCELNKNCRGVCVNSCPPNPGGINATAPCWVHTETYDTATANGCQRDILRCPKDGVCPVPQNTIAPPGPMAARRKRSLTPEECPSDACSENHDCPGGQLCCQDPCGVCKDPCPGETKLIPAPDYCPMGSVRNTAEVEPVSRCEIIVQRCDVCPAGPQPPPGPGQAPGPRDLGQQYPLPHEPEPDVPGPGPPIYYRGLETVDDRRRKREAEAQCGRDDDCDRTERCCGSVCTASCPPNPGGVDATGDCWVHTELYSVGAAERCERDVLRCPKGGFCPRPTQDSPLTLIRTKRESVEPVEPGACGESCLDNFDCASEELCCAEAGCGRVCRPRCPAPTSLPTPPADGCVEWHHFDAQGCPAIRERCDVCPWASSMMMYRRKRQISVVRPHRCANDRECGGDEKCCSEGYMSRCHKSCPPNPHDASVADKRKDHCRVGPMPDTTNGNCIRDVEYCEDKPGLCPAETMRMRRKRQAGGSSSEGLFDGYPGHTLPGDGDRCRDDGSCPGEEKCCGDAWRAQCKSPCPNEPPVTPAPADCPPSAVWEETMVDPTTGCQRILRRCDVCPAAESGCAAPIVGTPQCSSNAECGANQLCCTGNCVGSCPPNPGGVTAEKPCWVHRERTASGCESDVVRCRNETNCAAVLADVQSFPGWLVCECITEKSGWKAGGFDEASQRCFFAHAPVGGGQYGSEDDNGADAACQRLVSRFWLSAEAAAVDDQAIVDYLNSLGGGRLKVAARRKTGAVNRTVDDYEWWPRVTGASTTPITLPTNWTWDGKADSSCVVVEIKPNGTRAHLCATGPSSPTKCSLPCPAQTAEVPAPTYCPLASIRAHTFVDKARCCARTIQRCDVCPYTAELPAELRRKRQASSCAADGDCSAEKMCCRRDGSTESTCSSSCRPNPHGVNLYKPADCEVREMPAPGSRCPRDVEYCPSKPWSVCPVQVPGGNLTGTSEANGVFHWYGGHRMPDVRYPACEEDGECPGTMKCCGGACTPSCPAEPLVTPAPADCPPAAVWNETGVDPATGCRRIVQRCDLTPTTTTTAAPTTTTAPSNGVPSGCVWLFAEINFTGEKRELCGLMANQVHPTNFNDKTKSVQVADGVTVELYDGHEWTDHGTMIVSADVADLGLFNNRISNIKIS